jgi:general secretion pathway protein M
LDWVKTHRRSAAVVGITLLLPVVLAIGAIADLWSARMESQSEIDRIVPRMSRLLGLAGRESELRAALKDVDAELASLVFTAEQDRDTQAANWQKDIRERLVESGLAVADMRLLPPDTQEETLERIRLKLTLTGDMNALDAGLSSLAMHEPRILIESLDVKPHRRSRRQTDVSQQQVLIGMQLVSLRVSL